MLIKDMYEFRKLGYELEIETYKDLLRRIEEGLISLGTSELGVLLELLRFSTEDNIADDLEYCNENKVQRIIKEYGFSLDSPVSFLQNIREYDLGRFIDRWYQNKELDLGWNPDYAVIDRIDEKVIEYCKQNDISKVIKEFNMGLENSKNLIYPFDGWTLAECFRLSH